MKAAVREPGVLFLARDGNGVPVEDARMPVEGEPTDFLLDADGNAIRRGDYALVLDEHDWAGRVVKVQGASRALMYDRGVIRQAWSPSSAINNVQVKHRHTFWSVRPDKLRRVDLNAEEGKRLMLVELLDERAALDTQAATVEGERVRVSIQINRLRDEVGDRP